MRVVAGGDEEGGELGEAVRRGEVQGSVGFVVEVGVRDEFGVGGEDALDEEDVV